MFIEDDTLNAIFYLRFSHPVEPFDARAKTNDV